MGLKDWAFNEKKASGSDTEAAPAYNGEEVDDFSAGLHENLDQLHRRLGNRQIQLMAIGGSIGTALFVSIGNGLGRGGPGSLFLAYTGYSLIVAMINNCVAEMTVYMPVSGGFIRLAGKWVDDAFGFMAGWNFFFYEALLIPFEITALTVVLGFWSDNIPPWSIPIACIVLYACLNVLAVKVYGEAEFWLSGGKVILIIMLFCFTFITMVGGNPKHYAYGFRYWQVPGSFAEHITTGALGRFEGFLAALWSASFTVVGPEYISMVAAEAKRPRTYIKNAFKTVYWRFGLFFIMGALCVGIVVPYNDPTIVAILKGSFGGSGTAAASPYVIAMKNLGVTGFPHLVNALMVTSIFSAGNTYTYCATRTLYGLSLEGRAPKFLKKCTNNGIPFFCFLIVMLFPCLAFLQVSSNSALVLTWLVDLITAGGIIDYIIMSTTYIFFYRACKAQGLDRRNLPYTGWMQPWLAYIALGFEICVVFCFGYTSFMPWSTSAFFQNYALLVLAPITFTFWKVVKRTKFVSPLEADLKWEAPVIDAYEETFIDPPVGFWTEMLEIVGLGRFKKGRDRRASSVAEVRRQSEAPAF